MGGASERRLRSPEPLRVAGNQPLDALKKEVTMDRLSVAIAIFAGCVALLAAIGFALRRPRSPLLDKLVLVLEGALVVRAMLGVGVPPDICRAAPRHGRDVG
jgi:hypothetical protein